MPDIIKEIPAPRVSSQKKKTTQNMMDSLEYENQVDSAYLCGSSWAVNTEDDQSDGEEMNEGASFTTPMLYI